jgi:V/A-type H+-transporting ATPase subunit K
VSGLAGEELVVLAAGLAVAIPGIMAALGVAMSGVAAAAVSAEDPKKFSKLFVLQVMPGTQGIYGFVAAFLIMFVVYPKLATTGVAGLVVLLATLPAILQGFTSYSQGKVAVAGVSAVAKRPEVFGQSMMYIVTVELYAILGLLATILFLTSIHAL